MSIGENIRRHRQAIGLTQKQLAEKSGIAEITIRQYEANKYNPKIEQILKIAAALGVRAKDLTEYELDNEVHMTEKVEQMTEDTKQAVEILAPICRALNINISADENRLYLNGQGIRIACNSTYATVMEGFGYIFLKKYPQFRMVAVTQSLQKAIKRYWVGE